MTLPLTFVPVGKRFDLVPRIVLRLLQAEGDALLLLVDIEHDHVELLADLQSLARMPEAAPGHVGDMEEAVHAIEVDERAEIGEVFDGANTVSPTLTVSRKCWRSSARSCSMSSRRERTTFFRSSFTLTILKS